MKRWEIWVEGDKSSGGSCDNFLIAVAPGSDFKEACIAFLQKLFIDPIEYEKISKLAIRKAAKNATEKAMGGMLVDGARFEKKVEEILPDMYYKIRNGMMAPSFRKSLLKYLNT